MAKMPGNRNETDGRLLLLKQFRSQLEKEKNHSKIVALQYKIDEIVSQRYLEYLNR